MFDFFKDMYFETKGIDSEASKEERIGKYKTQRQERFIFSKGMKTTIIIMGVLYLLIAGAGISILKDEKDMGLMIVKFIILSLMDIATIICLAVGKKKMEIAALIMIFSFIAILYFSTIMN